MLTGESLPVPKEPGAEVWGATLNHRGFLVFKATRVGQDMVLSQIIRLVDEAQTGKAPIERLVDQVASIFVPVVMGLAALTFLVWYSWGPAAGLQPGHHQHGGGADHRLPLRHGPGHPHRGHGGRRAGAPNWASSCGAANPWSGPTASPPWSSTRPAPSPGAPPR